MITETNLMDDTDEDQSQIKCSSPNNWTVLFTDLFLFLVYMMDSINFYEHMLVSEIFDAN